MAKSNETVAAAFVLPTYETNRRVKMGALSAAIPDGMVVSKPNEEFVLLAYSKGFRGGAASYKDAPFSVNCKTAAVQKAAQLAPLWDGAAAERKAAFCGILQNRLERMGRAYKVKYRSLGAQLDVVYAQIGESEKGETPWCSYLALFFYVDTLYQVQLYINAPKNKALFMKAVDAWVTAVQAPVVKAPAKKPAEKKQTEKKASPAKAKAPAKTKAPAKKAVNKPAVKPQPVPAKKAEWLPRGTAAYRSRWVRK